MDCKMENAARSLVRIETLALQGIARSLFLFVIGIVVIPFMPFVAVCVRFANASFSKWRRVLCIPHWFVLCVILAVYAPFAALFRTWHDTIDICRQEWRTRWTCGQPKKLDGTPVAPPSEYDRRVTDIAYTFSAIRDYRKEAEECGQHIELKP